MTQASEGNVIELNTISPEKQMINVSPPFNWFTGFEGYDAEIDYLMEGVIPALSFGVVYGASGSFKSFLTIGWALHIATGLPWDNHRVVQGSVLYVVAEGGIGAPRRIKAWCDKYNNGKQPSSFHFIKEPVHVANDTQCYSLISTVQEIEERTKSKIGLIIIDTLARCFAGADENSTKDMNNFIAGCDTIKAQVNATVLVVHHSGKDDTKSARGSSALRAACDFEYKVKRPNMENLELILSCEKMKDDEPIQRLGYALESHNVSINKYGHHINSLVVLPAGYGVESELRAELKSTGVSNLTNNHEAVLQAVRSRTSKSEATNIAVIRDDLKAQGLATSNFSKWLTKLLADGLLKETPNGLVCINVA